MINYSFVYSLTFKFKAIDDLGFILMELIIFPHKNEN